MKNCCTDTGPGPRQVPASEIQRTLQTKAMGADAFHATQLGGLQSLRQSKGAMLAREQTRLSASLGPQNPRVLALSDQISVNNNLGTQLMRAQSRSQASVFEANSNTWIVHGHVRTQDYKPVPQVTVALYTPEGQWLRQFGWACTDANGYYKLTIQSSANTTSTKAGPGVNPVGSTDTVANVAQPDVAGEPAGNLKTNQVAGTVSGDRPAAGAAVPPPPPDGQDPSVSFTTSTQDTSSISTTGTSGGRKLCVNATDAQQRFLGGATMPVIARLGAIDYREILIDSTAAACTPPPTGTDGSPAGTPGTTGTQGAPGMSKPTQFLGNSHTREVHDLQNTKKNCRIDSITADRRVYFKTADDAAKAGYDYCAYCFGKAKSKR